GNHFAKQSGDLATDLGAPSDSQRPRIFELGDRASESGDGPAGWLQPQPRLPARHSVLRNWIPFWSWNFGHKVRRFTMKTNKSLITVLTFACALVTAPAFAQRGLGIGGALAGQTHINAGAGAGAATAAGAQVGSNVGVNTNGGVHAGAS